MLLVRCFKWPTTEGTTGADPTEEGAGGKMIWDDWDRTGKEFWDSTVKFWTGDDTDWDIDDYQSMKHYAGYSNAFQGYASTRMNELYNRELERYQDDHFKYTGQDLKDTRYPILQDRYRSGSEFGILQASEAVQGFYQPFKFRW